jgi:hypothetical protein
MLHQERISTKPKILLYSIPLIPHREFPSPMPHFLLISKVKEGVEHLHVDWKKDKRESHSLS